VAVKVKVPGVTISVCALAALIDARKVQTRRPKQEAKERWATQPRFAIARAEIESNMNRLTTD
jgi:hypothetical protein